MAHIEVFVKNKGQRKWKFIGEASHALRYSYKLWVEMEKKYLQMLVEHGTEADKLQAQARLEVLCR